MAIYLDNNATTKPSPEVCEAMLQALRSHFGNPSSSYALGRRAAGAMEQARDQVASLVGATAGSLVFTSGGTESNSTALSAGLALRPERRKILVSAVEHASVLDAAEAWAERGWVVVPVGVDGAGRLRTEALEEALDEETALVCIMAANNETGVRLDPGDWAERVHAAGALLHVDATQMAGKVPMHVREWGVDFAAFSAHKLHGPKGIGSLYIANNKVITPMIRGGGQEGGWRSGTPNVPGILGFGVAAAQAEAALGAMEQVAAMRDQLEAGLHEKLAGVTVQGGDAPRLPNTSSLRFEGVEAETLLALMDLEGLYASTGSACAAGAAEPSHVLRAMGLDRRAAREVVRFSLSRYTRREEIETVIDRVASLVASLRGRSKAGMSPRAITGDQR